MQLPALLSTTLLITSVLSAPVCDSTTRREGLRTLVEAIISGTDEDINKVSFTSNATAIVQVQGARAIVGKGIKGSQNAIRIGHAIATNFGPAPYDLSSYLDNGVNMAFVNGTATVGLHTPDGKSLGLVTVPAALSSTYDTSTCEMYKAVASVEPVDGVVQTALEALFLQNFPVYEIIDPVEES